MHPLLPQDELVEYGREHGINLVAYSPLVRGTVFDVPEIREVAEKHDASPEQVSLAWLLRRERVAAIAKATSAEHVRNNFGALDVARIDAIETRSRKVDPDFAPW